MTPITYTKHELFLKHKEVRRDFHKWRLTNRIAGHIHALPETFGILVATNGVLCLIERPGDRVELFCGHLEFFVPQDKEDTSEVEEMKAPQIKSPAKELATSLKELLDLC